MKYITVIVALIIAGCGGATLTTNGIEGDLDPTIPTGWQTWGTSGGFEYYRDTQNKSGGGYSAVILSTSAGGKHMGTLTQTIAADDYIGRRVRFSGYVKTNMVKDWTGLWLRIDSQSRQAIAFDNMQDRSIRGTTDWTRYDIVLNVPENAAMMKFGLLLVGSGQVWLDECTLEIVDDDVSTTGNWMSSIEKREPVPYGLGKYPINMGFDE